MDSIKKFVRIWGASIFAAICGVVAFAMIFLKAVVLKDNPISAGEYTGLQVAMGFTKNDITIFSPSVGILCAFFFPLVGACVAIIGNGNKIAAAIASAFFLTGGVLALCMGRLAQGEFVGTVDILGATVASGVLALVAAVAVLLPICFDFLAKKTEKNSR